MPRPTPRWPLGRELVAYSLFAFVEFYSWLVVVLWAYDEGGASLAGLAAVVQLVPAALVAPAVAQVGDRLPRGRALVLVHVLVAATAVALALALALDMGAVVVLTTGTLLVTSLATVRPVHFAALPQLATDPRQLVGANSASSVIDGCLRFGGSIAAGLAVTTLGPAQAMTIAAGAAVLAPILCMGLGLSRAVHVGPRESPLVAAFGGLRALSHDAASMALLFVMAAGFVISGSLDVLGVSFSIAVLGASEAGAGVLVSSLGVGGLLGAAAGSMLARRTRLVPLVTGGGVLMGLAFASVALVDTLALAFLLIGVAGFGGAVLLVSGRTLLQRVTDDKVLARVFAVQESTALIGVALGAGLSPLLIDAFGVRDAWLPLGLAAAVLGVVTLVITGRLDERARVRPTETALLRQVSFLAVLAPYELERLASATAWQQVPAGTAVVQLGELGTDFFVIGSGECVVELPGADRRPVLGDGDWFGELALLRAVPRAATVTTTEPTRLLVVPGEAFLAAVTGAEDGAGVRAEIAKRYAELDL